MSVDLSIDSMLDRRDDELPVVRVVVAATEGSAPREPGAAMLVDRCASIGTIGGGQLEFEAIARAREMLQTRDGDQAIWLRELRAYPLGPKLAQMLRRHGARPVRALRPSRS